MGTTSSNVSCFDLLTILSMWDEMEEMSCLYCTHTKAWVSDEEGEGTSSTYKRPYKCLIYKWNECTLPLFMHTVTFVIIYTVCNTTLTFWKQTDRRKTTPAVHLRRQAGSIQMEESPTSIFWGKILIQFLLL
jgi:hypothetical protein